MIFPKCMIGRPPFVSYTGQVVPCCWSHEDEEFYDEDFNLNNNKLADILSSDKWKNIKEKILYETPTVCVEQCSEFLVKDDEALDEGTSAPKLWDKNTKQKFKETLSHSETIFKRSASKFVEDTKIQIETTSRCTLACPYCERTIKKGTGKYYKGDLSLEALHDVINTKRWERVNDCGNYGDPTFYKYFHEFLDIMIDSPVNMYNCSVAATGRPKNWWKITIDKFLMMKQKDIKVNIVFGIDGLKGTSEKHRINQNYDEIWNNMIECKKAGLNSIWQVIATSKNENEIKKIYEISEKLSIPVRLVISPRFKPDDKLKPKNINLVQN